jgi:hypothetical integral membrane protein (TIGR02206 family)
MDPSETPTDGFSQGSLLHGVCLAVCALAALAIAVAARRWRNDELASAWWRRGIAVGCLLSWALTVGYSAHPARFSWDSSLPLQFCNLANLLGAYAVASRHRLAQALMYFWTFALSSWAFLTPSLYVGPSHLQFWIFWNYHVFIPIATAWILVADRFRPDWTDWGRALAVSVAYMGALAVLDAITGWNYGFVGPDTPTQANLLDFLGPYPIRLLWMLLVGTGLFALLMLPRAFRRRGGG